MVGSRLFTTSGTQYYHLFNISLCAGDGLYPTVSCMDNITFTEMVRIKDTIYIIMRGMQYTIFHVRSTCLMHYNSFHIPYNNTEN